VTHPYVKAAANSVDGTNRLQIEERANHSTAEIIAEFRQNGPIAIKNRQKLPWLVRQLPIPGMGSFGYLMDIIYPRDEWMHRYDICAATGKKMVITPEHDGRILDLVLLDIAKKLKRQLAGRQSAGHSNHNSSYSRLWSGARKSKLPAFAATSTAEPGAYLKELRKTLSSRVVC